MQHSINTEIFKKLKNIKKYQKEKMGHKIFLLSSLIIIFLIAFTSLTIPTASADSFFDWISGRATKPTNVTITVSQIRIPFVSAIPTQSVTEGSKTNIHFYFNATIPGGNASYINKTSAVGNFSLGGETTRQNSSCKNVSEGVDWVNFSCKIDIWYWDGAGAWTVTAFIKDNSQNGAVNTSTSMTLQESTCFVVSPNELTWQTIIPGATNQVSDNDPTLLNNTCNDNIDPTHIYINATDLVGVTNITYSILSSAFMTDIETGSAAECIGGASLSNKTDVAILNANLTAGNNSKNYGNATSGQEQLYYCIPLVDSGLIAQTYSTSRFGSWTVKIV